MLRFRLIYLARSIIKKTTIKGSVKSNLTFSFDMLGIKIWDGMPATALAFLVLINWYI